MSRPIVIPGHVECAMRNIELAICTILGHPVLFKQRDIRVRERGCYALSEHIDLVGVVAVAHDETVRFETTDPVYVEKDSDVPGGWRLCATSFNLATFMKLGEEEYQIWFPWSARTGGSRRHPGVLIYNEKLWPNGKRGIRVLAGWGSGERAVRNLAALR